MLFLVVVVVGAPYSGKATENKKIPFSCGRESERERDRGCVSSVSFEREYFRPIGLYIHHT